MLPRYEPKHFGKDYCDLKSDTEMVQYANFAAVVFGLKPSYDDWVAVDKFDAFARMCHRYGLVVLEDVLFVKPSKSKEELIHSRVITTAFTELKPINRDNHEGLVHVFVAKTQGLVVEAKKFGWYHGVLKDNRFNKPFIDHLRFGKCLGYPDCCIDFFKKYSDLERFSHPYQTYKNTLFSEDVMHGSYLCNNIRETIYFFSHHLPCSYRCPSTMRLAEQIEEALRKVEPDFVYQTRQILKYPILSFGERNYIVFQGVLNDEGIFYSDTTYFNHPAQIDKNRGIYDTIRKGDRIRVIENKIEIYKKGIILSDIPKGNVWFVMGFE